MKMPFHNNAQQCMSLYSHYDEIFYIWLMFTSISDTTFYELINDLNNSSIDKLLCSFVNRSKFFVMDVSKNL